MSNPMSPFHLYMLTPTKHGQFEGENTNDQKAGFSGDMEI
jgi:hypothetical protein